MNKAGIYTPQQIEEKFEIAWKQVAKTEGEKRIDRK